MADDPLDVLVNDVTAQQNAASSGDAADAIVIPDRDAIRASRTRRDPPKAQRPPDPAPSEDDSSDDDDDSDDDGLPNLSHPSADDVERKYRKYNKRELYDKIAALESLLADEKAARKVAEDAAAGPKEADPDSVRQLAQALTYAADIGFGIMARVRGPHWAIPKERAELIGSSGANALAPYSEGMGQWLPLAMFATILVGTIGEKLAEDRRISRLPADPSNDNAS